MCVLEPAYAPTENANAPASARIEAWRARRGGARSSADSDPAGEGRTIGRRMVCSARTLSAAASGPSGDEGGKAAAFAGLALHGP